jgi:hypothetical protein
MLTDEQLAAEEQRCQQALASLEAKRLMALGALQMVQALRERIAVELGESDNGTVVADEVAAS